MAKKSDPMPREEHYERMSSQARRYQAQIEQLKKQLAEYQFKEDQESRVYKALGIRWTSRNGGKYYTNIAQVFDGREYETGHEALLDIVSWVRNCGDRSNSDSVPIDRICNYSNFYTEVRDWRGKLIARAGYPWDWWDCVLSDSSLRIQAKLLGTDYDGGSTCVGFLCEILPVKFYCNLQGCFSFEGLLFKGVQGGLAYYKDDAQYQEHVKQELAKSGEHPLHPPFDHGHYGELVRVIGDWTNSNSDKDEGEQE